MRRIKSSIKWLIKTVIFFILLNYTYGFCPAKCTCSSEKASCINSGLEVVPIQLNPDVKYINLTLNHITNVLFSMSFYTKLEILDLSRNKIDSLGSKTFEFQYNLRLLNLSQNALTNLSHDAFKHLKSLTVLDLSRNKIDIIDQTAMHDLSSLIKLDLTNNYIISLDDGIFSKMISLEILIFRNNQLLDVPYDNLEHIKLLKSLDLSGNLIESVRNFSFDSLRELTFLNLQGNVISELDSDAFEGLVGLKVLDLADNNLTFVPTLQLSKLSNLTYLSLSGNSFTTIPPVALLNLFHLRELQLEHLDRLVKIDSRAFVDNTNLQIISLDNNPSFTDLPPRLFHGNPNLVEISIRGNDLKRLDAGQFPLDRLQRLRLGDNPLECNCSLLWLWRLTNGHYQDDDPTSNTTNILILDTDEIGCDQWEEKISRKSLKLMSESDIKCPAHIVTIICAIMSILVVIMAGTSILIYIKIIKRRKKLLHERKNVNERIVPQQVDKLELERYLAAQALANDYRALRPWELPVKDSSDFNNDGGGDHYEKFEYYDRRTLNKPHVVYV